MRHRSLTCRAAARTEFGVEVGSKEAGQRLHKRVADISTGFEPFGPRYGIPVVDQLVSRQHVFLKVDLDVPLRCQVAAFLIVDDGSCLDPKSERSGDIIRAAEET